MSNEVLFSARKFPLSRLLSNYAVNRCFDKEKEKDKYVGGTIMCDHATGLISICNQSSLYSGYTLQGKHTFEQFASFHGHKVKTWHGDNGTFATKAFKDDCTSKHQFV